MRDADTNEITEAQDRADVFEMRVGDCLKTSALGDEVASVPVVPCSEEHEDEIYFSFEIPDGDFPGDAEIDAAAETTCTREFSNFVGTAYEASTLDWSPFTPSAGSWSEGDREVLCVAFDPDGLTTGSLAGAAR
ncbi:septum formation family protein [Jonesiaceae bacterium BS-20]|uniref:Septum formation family protein n=1 Tax=Jonesiaceae bacterium BS-20 TaxID=3120821 RepID=A0AAU7DV27_9MICO